MTRSEHLRRAAVRCAELALIAAFGLSSGTAIAAYGNGAVTFAATCDGQSLTFVDEASGIWGSVKVSGTQTTFIPTSLTLNGHLVASHPATAPFPEVTCITTSHPEGTLTFTGFFVPPNV